jgi:murein L,D-transpeptidase YcbB/YkuD
MGADPLLFDASLTLALQRFQRRHGLYADGRISSLTVDALNLSVDARIAELEYARTAWTALSPQTKAKSVWVNIPEAEIAAVADAQIALRMRAVVGHPTRPTPQLSSQIKRVIVDPYWNVPQSIALQDLLPRQQADPQFFSRKGIRVYANWQDTARELEPAAIDWAALGNTHFPYRLRQDPGPENSLGRYKFDFPNDFDVYIHDTPSQALLGLSMRSLSSGCVRVADSAALARWLMADMPNVERQLAIDANRRTRGIRLPYPVPVNFVYLNAWVGAADGAVQFRRDIYGFTLAADLTVAR